MIRRSVTLPGRVVLAVQTTSFLRQPQYLRRIVAVTSLLVSLVCPIGCARTRPAITSLWQQVPPVRWPGRETSVEEPKPEPAVAANVALKKEGETESSGVASLDGKSKTISGSFGLRRTASEPRHDELPGNIDFGESVAPDSPFAIEPDHSNSPLDRLNAALSDDVRQTLPQRSVTPLEERVRVDSLISRAKELLDLGQLDQARDAAMAALELGEHAQLEYSPDEDRPIDLVRRIEGQQEAQQLTQEWGSEQESTANRMPPETDRARVSVSQAESADTDSKGTSRKQRGWSNLFRREKKPNAPSSTDLGHVTQVANEVTPKRQSTASNWPTTGRTSRPDTHDAIVMANRSVSLGSPENTSEPDPTSARHSELGRPDRDAANSPSAAPMSPVITDFAEDRSSRSIDSESRISSSADDSNMAVPDLEAEEIISTPRRVASSIDDELPFEELDDAESGRPPEGMAFYIGIGIAISIVIGSMLAIYWYRGRAT